MKASFKTQPFHDVLATNVAGIALNAGGLAQARVFSSFAKDATIPPAQLPGVLKVFNDKIAECERDGGKIATQIARQLRAGSDGLNDQIRAFGNSRNGAGTHQDHRTSKVVAEQAAAQAQA